MSKDFRDIMRGDWVNAADNAGQLYEYTINTKSWTVSETALWSANVAAEFPAIDPRVSCQQHRRIVMLTGDTVKRPPHSYSGLNEVSVANLESGERQFYRYADSQIPEEHLFVAKPGSRAEADGWLLGTVHDWVKQSTILNVFDINSVDAGPIAQAILPYALPLGLHGKFVEG
jgi:carotenoid cleavage dioxygenase-like enzyme